MHSAEDRILVLDAMPEWEGPMLAPRDEKMKLFRDKSARDALNARAQQPDNPMRTLANWDNKIIFDVVASENEQYRGRMVGVIAKDQGRDAWDVLCDIAVADELNTSFGSPTPPESIEDWKARAQVWRDRMALRPWRASAPARASSSSTRRKSRFISAPSRAIKKSAPGVNRCSQSSHGAEISGMPHASASNTRIVGMPGNSRTYGRRGMCTVARKRANVRGTSKFGSQPLYPMPASASSARASSG
jgi:hypothetical protein